MERVAGPVQVGVPTVTFAVQEPPVPVQETEYGPATETDWEPDGPPPVLNPPPVQLVAFVELHVSVEGTEPEGLAVREQVAVAGAAADATVTCDQAPQLLLSSDSVMMPLFPADDLSAHART